MVTSSKSTFDPNRIDTPLTEIIATDPWREGGGGGGGKKKKKKKKKIECYSAVRRTYHFTAECDVYGVNISAGPASRAAGSPSGLHTQACR